jgi:hypothetical protein
MAQNGSDIHTIHELIGHNDIQTTMIYNHVNQRSDSAVYSPLDMELNFFLKIKFKIYGILAHRRRPTCDVDSCRFSLRLMPKDTLIGCGLLT